MLCMKKELRPIEILLKFSTEATLHRKVHPKLKSRTSVQVWVPEAKKSSQFENIAFCSFITNTKNTKNMSKRTRNRQNIQLHVWKVAGKQESPSDQKHMKKAGYFEFFRGDLKGRLPGVGILKKSCFILRPLTPRFQDGGVIHDDWLFSDKGRGGEIVNFSFRSGNVKARLHGGNQLGKGE